MVVFNRLNQIKPLNAISANKVAKIVTLLLVIWFGWVVGRLLWSWLQPSVSVMPWQPTHSTRSTQNKAFPVAELTTMNLFGAYEAKPTTVIREVKQDAPETRLNLTLNGVVASSDPNKALAIISNKGKQNTYGLNEVIEGTRATLQDVSADRVIIRNNGQDETLMLEGVKYGQSSSASHSPDKNTSKPQVSSEPAEHGSDEQLSEIKREILKNPQTLFTYIRLSQVKKDDKLIGYRVNPGKNSTLFDAVGLKPNDLAVTINGNDLTDPSVMARLWTELSQAAAITLGVEREGQLHDIYIELQ